MKRYEKNEKGNVVVIPEFLTRLCSPISCEASNFQNTSVQVDYDNPHEYDTTLLRWRNLSEVYEHCNLCIIEPKNFDDVAQDGARKIEMQEEMNLIEKNKTWELINRLLDKPVIRMKWVYKAKMNLDGSIQKNKARLVAKMYA